MYAEYFKSFERVNLPKPDRLFPLPQAAHG